MPVANTSSGWAEKWSAARANGPTAVAELRDEVRFHQARGALRQREEDLATLKALTKCVKCKAPIPSLVRLVCPPCTLKAGL